MGSADLHIHTTYSWDGTCSVEAVLKQAADVANLDVIAITDHDEIRGALKAEEIAHRYQIDVIPGSEISTSDGHLLALFVREKISAGLTLVETARRVHELGGLCVIPHPEARLTQSIDARALSAALRDETAAATICGVEVFNAGLWDQRANQRATIIAERHGMAKTGSSDSHLLWTIGSGVTRFPGRSTGDLRSALCNRWTSVYMPRKTGPAMILLSWLRGHLLRRAGWIEYNASPEEPVRLTRMTSVANFVMADK